MDKSLGQVARAFVRVALIRTETRTTKKNEISSKYSLGLQKNALQV